MLDQIVGLLLFGLGLKNPSQQPQVKGDSTEASGSSGSGGSHDSSGATGASTANGTSSTDDNHRSGATGTSRFVETDRRFSLEPPEVEKRHDGSGSGEDKRATGTTIRQIQVKNIHDAEDNLREVFSSRLEKEKSELAKRRLAGEKESSVARANFKAKLSEIKNTAKRQVATAIDTKINDINKKRTDLMLSNLSKMQEVLDKIVVREGEAQKAGRDITAVDAAVTAARTAITSAIAAVNTQAGKSYIPTITTEEGLKTSMSTAMQSFITDMKATYETVKTAHQAVVAALSALGSAMEGLLPTVTPTP